jgi:hypothetical protein
VSLATGDIRLRAASPCIDAGINADWMDAAEDIFGNPRVFNGRVDIGACEFTMTTHVKAWLQGAYRTTRHGMTNALQAAGALPAGSPYAADRLRSETLPTNTVDWVLLELRRTNDLRTVASKGVLLRSDGAATDESGQPGIRLEASPGFYFLTARHRNHLSAMSAQPVAFTNELVTYDFAVSSNRYFRGTNACVALEPGVWGLIAGDADGDGKITPADREIVKRQMGNTGYLSGDVNLDGVVDGGD